MTATRSTGATATARTDRTLLGLIAGLAVYNVARSTLVDGDVDIAANVTVGAAVVLAGRWAGLSRRELGLDRARLGAGLRLGSLAAAAVVAVVVVGALVLSASGDVDDDRVEVSFPAMLLRVLVVIPIATAVVEEAIFRGVLLGLLRRRFTVPVAVGLSAVLFGLWHVYPAWLDSSGAAVVSVGRWASVIGTFVATTAAGLAFAWLRHRSGHLVAPVLAHTATNSTTFFVAWLAAR